MKKGKNFLIESLRELHDILFSRDNFIALNKHQKQDIKNSITLSNIKRIFWISILTFIYQIVFIIIHYATDFYIIEGKISVLNKIATYLLLPTTFVAMFLCCSLYYKNNFKASNVFVRIYFFIYLASLFLMMISELHRNVIPSTIIYMSILLAIGINFSTKEFAVYYVIQWIAVLLIFIMFSTNSLVNNLEATVLILSIMLLPMYLRGTLYKYKRTEYELRESNIQLTQMADTDMLTELPNRRGLNEFLENNISNWMTDNVNFCLVVCDIDYFKNYNDTYTHVKGDECLKTLGNCFREFSLRNKCFFSRMGGEEFCVLFWAFSSSKYLNIMLNKLLKNVEDLNIKAGKGVPYQYLTMSMGACVGNVEEKFDIEEMYKIADKQLYKAKANGRNRYCIANIADGDLTTFL